MYRLRCAILVVGVGLLAVSSMSGQDKKTDKDEPAVKTKLPAYWSKLGLSDEQKEKYYRIHAAYKAKIDDLDKKLKQLKDEEKDEEKKILTEPQKAKLRELLLGEKPADKDKAADKDKSVPKDKDK
jgi:hypothetical protein